MSMKPEIKKLWVEALRSGKYKQGTGSMRERGKHCCLGVLTDLYCKETGKRFRLQFPKKSPMGNTTASVAYNTNMLSTNIKRWSGLEQPNIIEELAERNDGSHDENDKQSFAQIATVIEVREDI